MTAADTFDRAGEDRLLDGRVRLRQPANGYRAAIDPVFLAAAIPPGPARRVLDLGCGVGAATFCLLARLPEVEATGLEIQPQMAALARDNAVLNDCADRFTAIEGNLSDRSLLPHGGFDEVMCNPPHQLSANTPAPDPAKARATHEGGRLLTDWVEAALYHLRPKGALTLIHRADRLDDLLAALHGRAGGLTVFPLWPKAGQPAKRVLIRARIGARAPTTLVHGLVLHEADGRFTPAARRILREGRGLEL